MSTYTTLQVDHRHLAITLDHLPPIGTQVPVHKHLTGDGNARLVEVIGHQYSLDEPVENQSLPQLNVRILTKTIR